MFTVIYGTSIDTIRRVHDFGERLRRLREDLKLSQGDLARTKNLVERRNFGRYVSKIENGDERNPSLRVIDRLAKGCGFLELSEFFLQLEQKNPSVASPVAPKGDKDRPPTEATDSHGAHLPTTTDLAEAIALFKEATRIVKSRPPDETARPDRALHRTRASKSGRRKSRA